MIGKEALHQIPMILATLQSRHVQAIQLLLEGELKDKEIAQKLGVRPDTLAKWKASPVFQERYQLELGIWEEDLRDIRLASFKRRFQEAQADHAWLEKIKTQSENAVQGAAVMKSNAPGKYGPATPRRGGRNTYRNYKGHFLRMDGW